MSNGRKNTAKIIASVALVAGAAGVAGLGTYGAFTSSTTASTNVGTGVIELGPEGPSDLKMDLAKMVAGDNVQRAFTLTRSGESEEFGSVSLVSSAAGNTLLTTGTTPIALVMDTCATAWTVEANAELSCAAGSTEVLESGPANRVATDLEQIVTSTLNESKAAHLRITVTLPEAADNTYQNLSDTLTFAFTATQRAGEVR